MTVRLTTDYLLTVPAKSLVAANHIVDSLLMNASQIGIEIGTTAVYSESAGVRFRIRTDDAEAMRLATQIADGRDFTLSTGYGTHRRQVTGA